VVEGFAGEVMVAGEGECVTLGRRVIVQEEADADFLMVEQGNVAGAKTGSKREIIKVVARMGLFPC